MNGAETLVRTLLASGVNTCFANPGTSEMHFVAALDRVPGMHCVLCLFEGVATGAADGYGRMAEKPAITLLHGGPGLGNGLANLHNARRAQTPVLNVVGDQATHHRPLDPPLTADTEGWARGLSAWTRVVQSVSTIGADAAAAVQAARTAHGQIATLIAPADTCWDDGGIEGTPLPVPPAGQVAPHVIRQIAQVLRSGEPAVLILGGSPIRATMVADAQRIAAATGAKLTAAQFNARVERGRGRHPIPRLPYGIDQAMAVMAGAKHIVLIGTMAPVAPFAYPDRPGYLAPEAATTHVLARPEQDVADALPGWRTSWVRLTSRAGAQAPRPADEAGIIPENITQMLAALLPENAMVVDESVRRPQLLQRLYHRRAPRLVADHRRRDRLGHSHGTGAAIAGPGRRVVTLQADRSAMYTVQALWTQARERLPITRSSSQPKVRNPAQEMTNVGANPGRVALDMIDIGDPDIGWPSQRHGHRGGTGHHSERIRRPLCSGRRGPRSVPDRIDHIDISASRHGWGLAAKDSLEKLLDVRLKPRDPSEIAILIGKEFDLTGDLSQQEPPLLSRRPFDGRPPCMGISDDRDRSTGRADRCGGCHRTPRLSTATARDGHGAPTRSPACRAGRHAQPT